MKIYITFLGFLAAISFSFAQAATSSGSIDVGVTLTNQRLPN